MLSSWAILRKAASKLWRRAGSSQKHSETGRRPLHLHFSVHRNHRSEQPKLRSVFWEDANLSPGRGYHHEVVHVSGGIYPGCKRDAVLASMQSSKARPDCAIPICGLVSQHSRPAPRRMQSRGQSQSARCGDTDMSKVPEGSRNAGQQIDARSGCIRNWQKHC